MAGASEAFDLFEPVSLDYGGLRWTVTWDRKDVRVQAKHPVVTGDAFDRKFPLSPNDFSKDHRLSRGAELIRQAARTLGIKEG